MKYEIQKPKVEDGKVAEAIKIDKNSIIEKTGHIITFSLQQVLDNDAIMEKRLREMKAQREVEVAKMKNIEHHHDFVLKFTPEQLFTAHMYQEIRQVVGLSDFKIKEIENQLKSDADEIEVIKSQIPELKRDDPVASPYVPVKEASADEDKPVDLI